MKNRKLIKNTGYRIRLTEDELKFLHMKADESGMSVAEYIREKIFGDINENDR